MRFLFICCLSLGLLCPAIAQSEAAEAAYEQRQFRNAEDDSLLYRWLAPDSLLADVRYPLVVFLHGAGERGDGNTAQLKHVLPRFIENGRAFNFPCFVFAPQCPNEQRWSNGVFDEETRNYLLTDSMSKPLAMTIEAMGTLLQRHPIDTSRIYVVGLSMGGAAVWELAFRYPSLFAAAVPICGFADTRFAPRIKDLPVWAFHGADDSVVPPAYSRQIVVALRAAGGHPVYTEFEGVGHDSWGPAFSNLPFIYDWLFAQRK
jgi:predicted peptidase